MNNMKRFYWVKVILWIIGLLIMVYFKIEQISICSTGTDITWMECKWAGVALFIVGMVTLLSLCIIWFIIDSLIHHKATKLDEKITHKILSLVGWVCFLSYIFGLFVLGYLPQYILSNSTIMAVMLSILHYIETRATSIIVITSYLSSFYFLYQIHRKKLQ